MCGIFGVVRSRATRRPPDLATLVVRLDDVQRRLGAWSGDAASLDAVAATLLEVDVALRGVPGVEALLADRPGADALGARVATIVDRVGEIEGRLDAGATDPQGAELEQVNAALLRARDPLWAIGHDRLRTADAVGDLAGADPSTGALETFTSVQLALSALDRLEVRGRDSAGLHLLVRGHQLDLDDPAVRSLLAARADPLFGSGAVRTPDGTLVFVYKAAAEIGDLGDNTRRLRAAIRDDELLHVALAPDPASATVLAHTRWASVGIISEPNAHPVSGEEVRPEGPYVAAALNGDVDNYADLITVDDLHLPAEITTDTKVIPALVARRCREGLAPLDAFRATAAALEGSVAVAAVQADQPDSLFLALRGSGQALYVGFAEDAFVVASEPYGLVEETQTYLRLDGDTPADPERAAATRGQIVVVAEPGAGTLDGIQRLAYDGSPLPVLGTDLQGAQITTRDIDRGTFPHYLLKEISEAPDSFRKTLRGKIVEDPDGALRVRLGDETLPESLTAALRRGDVRRVEVIGQGTAAVAAQSLALFLDDAVGETLKVDAVHATELSGFGLRSDMSDTLVVAISQSGTTTDTNRTVDLARDRGATIVSIVNRRNSDLVDKSDGVLYTSDGRDVEMSVASTKAFYAQVAAGALLAVALAQELGCESSRASELLAALRVLPEAMQTVVGAREAHRGRRAASRPQPPVLGGGRERAQRDRSPGAADQAL